MSIFRSLRYIVALGALTGMLGAGAMAGSVSAQPTSQTHENILNVKVFNLGPQGMFQVSSELIEGERDAILIDAQFSAADARELVDWVKTSGKRLVTIYISHSDPDYYFGLDTLRKAFPDAQILATPQTIARIEETYENKLRIWGPELGDNAPERIILPTPLQGDTLILEGQPLKIMGLDGPEPSRSYVWIPSIKTVLGGIPVNGDGQHLFMADARTLQAQTNWLATLESIRELKPTVVVPGHFIPGTAHDLSSVDFTANYIRAFQEEAAKAKNSTDLIAAMKQRFPNLSSESSLELSAKVVTGEMEW